MTRADSQSAAEHQQAISTHLQADHQHDTVPPPSLMPDRASNAQSLPMEDEKEDPGVVDELTNTEAQLESGRASDGPNLGPDLSTIRTVLLGAAMTLTFVLGAFCNSIVTIVLPRMAADLNISSLQAQWVVSAYNLSFGCGLLFSGRLADLYGRKMLYLGGLTVFCACSVASASIRNRTALCVVRAICGLGLAIASPAGFGITGVAIRREPARTICLSAFGLGGPLGGFLGLLLGGVLGDISRRGWSYVFYLIAGIALVPIIIGVTIVPPHGPRQSNPQAIKDRRIDWLGGFLITAGLCLFTYSLTESGITPKGWRAPQVPALFATSFVLIFLFLAWERYLELHSTLPPVLKPSFFSRNRHTAAYLLLISFMIVIPPYGWIYLATFWYQDYKGYNPLQTAIHLLPASITGMLVAIAAMWLAPRLNVPWTISITSIATGLTGVLFAAQPEGTPYWACEFIAEILLPWGVDIAACLCSVIMSNIATEDEQSVAGALFQTSLNIGATMGSCLSSLVSTIQAEKTGSLREGLRAAFWMSSAFGLLVPVVTMVGLRHIRLAQDAART